MALRHFAAASTLPTPAFLTPRRLASVAAFLGRSLSSTLRVRIIDRAGVLVNRPDPGQIWAFWHNRLFIIPFLREFYMEKRAVAALTSASRDGDILAAFLDRLDIKPVRGSSSRRGVAALLELRRAMDEGLDVAITPDGPRGPRYQLNPGILLLAQKSGRSIIPIGVEYSKCWRLGRWDGFMIPKPFAHAVITYGEPYFVRASVGEPAFEAERRRLEEMLMALTLTH